MDFSKLKKIYSDENNVVYDVRNTPYSFLHREARGYVLDEDIVFGKDYPTGSIDYDTFEILSFLKKKPILDEYFINFETKTAYGEPLLRKILMEKGYIAPIDSDKGDFEDELFKMDASELSNMLKKHGIVASGKKKKLLKLALKNITALDFENCQVAVTESGEKFLEDYEWIGLYDICLSDFEFDDFYKFIDENGAEDLIQTALDYIDKHLEHAHECKDFGYVSCCIDARAYVYLYGDDLCQSLKEEIRNYIFRINPIYDYEDYYSIHALLDYYGIEGIGILASQLEIDDLEEIFNDIWDSMNLEKEFVSKKEAYMLLNELFDENKFDDLCEKYLNEVIL